MLIIGPLCLHAQSLVVLNLEKSCRPVAAQPGASWERDYEGEITHDLNSSAPLVASSPIKEFLVFFSSWAHLEELTQTIEDQMS